MVGPCARGSRTSSAAPLPACLAPPSTSCFSGRSGRHWREQSGSIQEFVASDGDASDFRFDGSDFDVAQSQRLAFLDIQLFNCDRHEGNILVRELPPEAPLQTSAASPAADDRAPSATGARKRGVVPIDHAFCLPAFGHYREAELAWRYWLSAALPFESEVRAHVAAIDVDADARVARAAGLDEPGCATLRVCSLLLRRTLLAADDTRARRRDHACCL